MWAKDLLLGVVLLGLISGGRSKIQSPPDNQPDNQPIEPIIEPLPASTCRSPDIRTEPPSPKCNYYMVVPFKLTSGCNGVICTWLKCEVPVSVTVTMEYYFEQNTIVDKEDTTEYFECTHFTVPEVEKQESIYFSYEAVGKGVEVRERKPATIDAPRSACLPQKDKPFYKQGDTVQLRFPCYDENLKQVVKNFTKVTVVDPIGIRVFQDLNPTIENGVATMSFHTSEFSRLGYWSIEFEDDKGQTQYTSAQLKDYNLPRFDWNTNCPNTISVLDKTAEIRGSAQYVYGKPVPGTVVTQCCRRTPKYGSNANCFRGVDDICVEFTKELDENGNFTEHLDMDIFKLPFSGLDNSLTCEMTLKEDGTGILVPSSCYMYITNRLAVLQLDRPTIGDYFNKVSLLFAATLTDEKNNPLAFKEITVQIDGSIVKYVTTDANGRAECEIDTSSYYKANITLSATYSPSDLCYGDDSYGGYYSYTVRNYPYDEVTLYRKHSHSNSHIRLRHLPGELPCHQSHSVQLDYALTEDGVGPDATMAKFNYIISSRNRIATYGEISVDLSRGLQGSTYIEFYADHNTATGVKILAFTAMQKEIISDIVSLDTGLCFKNEVNLEFTEPIVAPGATVERKITAEPGSFCGLRAKDSSFDLLYHYDEFSASSVYSLVQSYVFRLQYGDVNYEDQDPPCIDGNKELFCNGIYVTPTSSRTDRDSNEDFVDLNLLLTTNLHKNRPKVCGEETEPDYPIFHPMGGAAVAFSAEVPGASSGERSIDIVRFDFKEIFGYSTAIIGPEGETIISSQIPHTITSWNSDAFCVSSGKGFGVTIEEAKTTTFQPFSVEASVPIYVTRGEVVIISITAANYLDTCTQVKAEVHSSEEYEVTFLDDVGEQCACSQQRVHWTASVQFLKIGKVNISIKASTTKMSDTCDGTNDDTRPTYSDTIILGIDVAAEGIPREASSSHLLTAEDSTTTVEIPVSEPYELVPDSFKCIASIMGDSVALSVENFDHLLSTPSGCFEQIEAEVLAIIFLAQYLKEFGELSEDRSKKMMGKLSTGYMNMLSFRQYDGGYSRYRNSYDIDPQGTLLGLRTNYFLEEYFFIDESLQTEGIISVSRYQDLESGCLKLNRYSESKKEDDDYSLLTTAMSAPILLELSEKHSTAGPLLDGVKKCLDNLDFESLSTLTQSYILDAEASFGDLATWQSHYSILQGKAVYDGDLLFWESDNSVKPLIYQYFPRSSGDVLSTAIVLRSLTKHPNPDQDLINQMASIAKWLSGQLTLRGGWHSSRATSAAIEALTRFGRLINTGETNAQVSLKRDGTEVFSVTIDKSNKFIVHSIELSPSFGEYTFTVTGTASPLVQISAFYNTMISTGQDSAYTLSAVASADCFGGVASLITIEISLSSNGVYGGQTTTYLSVDILTGYEASYPFVKDSTNVKEPRVKDKKYLLYIDTDNSDTITFTLEIFLRDRVTTFQTAYIVAEDIYTGETGAAEYRYPCDNELTHQEEE